MQEAKTGKSSEPDVLASASQVCLSCVPRWNSSGLPDMRLPSLRAHRMSSLEGAITAATGATGRLLVEGGTQAAKASSAGTSRIAFMGAPWFESAQTPRGIDCSVTFDSHKGSGRHWNYARMDELRAIGVT